MDDAIQGSLAGDATLMTADHASGWVLVDSDPLKAMGRCLIWAEANRLEQLNLVVDISPDEASDTHVSRRDPGAVLARRAQMFRLPGGSPRVFAVNRSAQTPSELSPRPAVMPAAEGPGQDQARSIMEEVGIDVVVEHGFLAGEVLGLEVARTVANEDGVRIEVGVGRNDREAHALVNPGRDATTSLMAVSETVRRHRVSGAAGHPLALMARSRWLMREIVGRPEVLDLGNLSPVSGALVRDSVDDPGPSFAAGVDREGRPVLVASCVGVDPDLLPAAADARALHVPGGRLIVVVPRRDSMPIVGRISLLSADPVETVVVGDDWMSDLHKV